ncbi:enoyl-CoA hydratase/isomerase family protein [Bordetella trematum]|uniref:enoyl-CoA hydratase/isomerase family protein n=1 Tax=Bordetella trematum TaxID=123899 RepID=UPI000D9A1169|nr:enoyl-CoA hydratase/isomerase family protein [Bordetella trematum]SPU54310.1 enoyl-CoA hydratase/isomerase [Bordetella trematum]VDH02925.1 Probable enoyl-CoA hydratase echA6 [Bordetella trematum]
MTAAAEAVLRVQAHDSHWVLTLNRPEKRNALSAELVEQLLQTLDLARAQSVPLLVLQGEGSNFSAGFDFTAYEELSEGDLVLRFVRIETLLQALAYGPYATLALAHGNNFGAGVDLIAACRLRWAAPQSRFRMPGLKFGLALGTRRLAELVGESQAYGLLESTRTFDADEAQRIGFLQGQAGVDDWPARIEQTRADVLALPAASRQWLQALTRSGNPDGDMAALVRSAAEPGLKARIQAFRAESARKPA